MLRLGVIGVGAMGQNHARIYSDIGDLVGVFDAIPETARNVAKRLGTNAFGSERELLASVDAVSVCTPTTKHYESAKMAIEQDKAVLVEKPFTGDVERAQRLCRLAEDRGVTLASGFVERFNPAVEATKKMLTSGKMGRLVCIGARRVSSFPSRIRDVGVIKDLAVHDIDVIRYMTGREVLSVSALGGRLNGLPCEDYANLLMQMEDGFCATIEVSWLIPMKVRTVALTCSQGFAMLDYTDQSLKFSTSRTEGLDLTDLSHIPMELNTQHLFVKKEEPLKRELEAFLHAAESNARASVDGWDALANIKVCDAAIASLANGGKATLVMSSEEEPDRELKERAPMMILH